MHVEDQFHRFIFEDIDIRGEIVRLGQSTRDAFQGRNYPEAVEQLLSESVAAAVLLSGVLKFEGILTLQARGNGPIQTLVAEATSARQFRATAQWEEPIPAENLQQQLGEAQLAITIDPTKGQRYQGIVPLEQATLSACLEDYFKQSEQLATMIRFFRDENGLCALMLQQLPSTQPDLEEHWEHLTTITETIKADELLYLSVEEILHRLYHQQQVRLFEPESVQFQCNCSHQRSAQTLKSLGKEELDSIIEERGVVEMDCHFCGQHYEFTEAQVADLFSPPPLH